LTNSSKRIKVTYVYKDFDIYNGLIETFLILARKKKTLPFDFEVCVFQNEDNEHSREFKSLGCGLVNLNSRWGSNPVVIYKLYKLFRNSRPDIVQTFVLKPNLFGIAAALLARVPVSIATDLTLKDQAPTRMRRLRDKFLYRIYAGVANQADQVISVSDASKEELRELGIKVGISVIPPPIDTNKTDLDARTESRGENGSQEAVVIGIVARLSEEKRHLDLLEAFSRTLQAFPNTCLVIVGDGPLRGQLEARAQKLGMHEKVSFVGFQKDVNKYLRMMDIFVLPSRTEGMPIAIMEAMAWQLPVIASRVGGIPEIVDDQATGILFDLGNIDQLTNALTQLISDPQKRKAFGESGKRKVFTTFHPDKFVESHYELYRALLKQRKVS